MKNTLLFLLTFIYCLTNNLAAETETTTPTPTFPTEEQLQHTRTPKTYEPVFPLQDLIKEPPKENDKFFAEFINMLATLGLIIGLILIVAWFLKRLVNTRIEQANSNSSIKILERRNLSPKSILYLLEIEGTAYLVAESVNGITRLSEFPIAQETNEKTTSSTSFTKLMEKK